MSALEKYRQEGFTFKAPHPTTGAFVEYTEKRYADAAIAELRDTVEEMERFAAAYIREATDQLEAMLNALEQRQRAEHAEAERDEARAEAEALKCCGNCEHLCENNATLWPCSEGGWTKPIDPCHFTPSRWKEAER